MARRAGMRYARSVMVGTVLVTISTTFGVYAWQEIQDQAQSDQTEQTPGRSATSSAATTTTTYLVRLDADPVVKYRGGNPQFRPTAPAPGQKLDPNDPAVISYASYLDG